MADLTKHLPTCELADWDGRSNDPKPICTCPDIVCEHGTAMDVHCCNCHSGFIFDPTHECPVADLTEKKHEPQATVADPRGLDRFLSPAASRDVDGDQMFSITKPSLEEFLARYYSWCVVGNEARGEWFWLDQIEDAIGRERYRQIMRGDKPDV